MRVLLSRMHRTGDSAGKAKFDVRDILRREGYRCLDMDDTGARVVKVARSFREAPRVRRVTRKLTSGDILMCQYPLGPVGEWLAAQPRRPSTIALVHDLESVRQGRRLSEDAESLRRFDAIISSNAAMTQLLREQIAANTPIIELKIFDYLCKTSEPTAPSTETARNLYLVGNLAAHKIAWLMNGMPTKNRVIAYGPNFCSSSFGDLVDWRGLLDIEDPRIPVIDGFGLVWDGKSPDGLTDNVGNYLRVNSPHKVSFYILAGLPVIVPRESAIADFVESNGVGVGVCSVQEADEFVSSCDGTMWKRLLGSVQKLRAKLVEGHFTRSAVKAAEEAAWRTRHA